LKKATPDCLLRARGRRGLGPCQKPRPTPAASTNCAHDMASCGFVREGLTPEPPPFSPQQLPRTRITEARPQVCRKLGEFAVDATVSGGVATSAAPLRSLGMLLASADVALYKANIEGRNRIKLHPSPDDGEPGVISSQEAAAAARPLRASPPRGLITMAPRPSQHPLDRRPADLERLGDVGRAACPGLSGRAPATALAGLR
jgi:hypothetical protein